MIALYAVVGYYLAWVIVGVTEPLRRDEVKQVFKNDLKYARAKESILNIMERQLNAVQDKYDNNEIGFIEYKNKKMEYIGDYVAFTTDKKAEISLVTAVRIGVVLQAIKTVGGIMLANLVVRGLAGVPLVYAIFTGETTISLLISGGFMLLYALEADSSLRESEEEDNSAVNIRLTAIVNALFSQLPLFILLLIY